MTTLYYGPNCRCCIYSSNVDYDVCCRRAPETVSNRAFSEHIAHINDENYRHPLGKFPPVNPGERCGEGIFKLFRNFSNGEPRCAMLVTLQEYFEWILQKHPGETLTRAKDVDDWPWRDDAVETSLAARVGEQGSTRRHDHN